MNVISSLGYPVAVSVVTIGFVFKLVMDEREENRQREERLMDMECHEPNDILLDRYERWESRKEQLEEQISDLNDEISDLELEYEV